LNIHAGNASITPAVTLALSKAFDTTPQLWINLQANYDLWIEKQGSKQVKPIVSNGKLLSSERNLQICRAIKPSSLSSLKQPISLPN